MSISKITPFLSEIKTFFNNSDMTRAMNTLSYILSTVKMTERDTITVRSKPNSVYPLLSSDVCSSDLRMFSTGSWTILRSVGVKPCGI